MDERIELKGKIYSNLNRPVRWNGIIDYKTIITVAVYILGIWNLIKLFTTNVVVQIYITLILTIPFVIFIKAYINETDIIYMLVIILRFCLLPRLYIYDIQYDGFDFIYDYSKNIITYKNSVKIYKLRAWKHKKWHKK